jgi:hypothetical protein
MGVAKDPDKALEWYTLAAEQGDRNAQYKLGEIFETGELVEQDMQAAFHWYRKAAEQNHPNAEFLTGLMYSRGEGTVKDDMLAAKWLQKAAANGHVFAQYHLAEILWHGRGVKQNKEEALRLYHLVASYGPEGLVTEKMIEELTESLNMEDKKQSQ